MSEPFIGEVRLFAFGFPPKNWAACNGQLLPIAQNQALFSLLGTTYGGNGTVNFALPDLRDRVPLHPSAAYPLGTRGGAESVVLSSAQMPAHAHAVNASNKPGLATAPPGYPAAGGPYGGGGSEASLQANVVPPVGGNQPVSVLQPYLAVQFCIALQGIFPARS